MFWHMSCRTIFSWQQQHLEVSIQLIRIFWFITIGLIDNKEAFTFVAKLRLKISSRERKQKVFNFLSFYEMFNECNINRSKNWLKISSFLIVQALELEITLFVDSQVAKEKGLPLELSSSRILQCFSWMNPQLVLIPKQLKI